MKTNKNILSVMLGALLALMLTSVLLPTSVWAAGSVDTGRDTHLTISYVDDNTALAGANFALYRVAAVEQTGELTPVAPFEQYNVDIRGKNDSAWKALASTLEGYVLRDDIAPYDRGSTDATGTLSFPSQAARMETGLYLVLGERHVQGSTMYDAEPFMIMLPTVDKQANEWVYSMTVLPKHESQPVPVEPVSLKVLKVWDDKGNEAIRPKEITVQLLKDGDVFDSVTLSAANNWRYTWDELDGKSTWTVTEKELEGYTVSVTREGITFVVTNTCVEPPVTPPIEPKPPMLPQTGQLWWPVFVLLAGGLLLLIFGVIRRQRSQHDQ